MNVDPEHFVDHLMLTEIDVRIAYGDQERTKDLQRRPVVLSQEGIRSKSKVFVYLPRLGITNPPSCCRERNDVGHNLVGRACWLPSRSIASCTVDYGVDHPGVRLFVEPGDDVVYEVSQLLGIHGVQGRLGHR